MTLRYAWGELRKPRYSSLHLLFFVVMLGWVLFSGKTNRQKHPSTGVDSTTFFQELYRQQKQINAHQQALYRHNQRIRDLYEHQDSVDRVIDGLSGDDLQREIDRQFNVPRHATPGRTAPNRSERSRGAAGPPVQKQVRNSLAGTGPERPIVICAGYDYPENGFDCDTLEPRWAGNPEQPEPVPTGFSPDPAAVARSQTGERGLSWGFVILRSRQDRPTLIRKRHRHFISLILSYDLCYPKLAAAISMVETGGMVSQVCHHEGE